VNGVLGVMSGPVIRVDAERRFPVSVREGFDSITDPANWPAYWPRFVRLAPESRWSDPGDRARLTLRTLGREVELDMTLARREPYRLVEYTSEQRGLPAARHRRHFDDAAGQLAYRIVIEYSPRAAGAACWTGRSSRRRSRAARVRRWRTSSAGSASGGYGQRIVWRAPGSRQRVTQVGVLLRTSR
jgi:hypothetical protein